MHLGDYKSTPLCRAQCPKPLHLGLQLHIQLLARYVVGEGKNWHHLTTWLDEVGSQLLAVDDDHEDWRAAKIAKNEQDKGRRRPKKMHKKHLHILFDPNIKAFQSWEAMVELWSLATCEKFIEWWHIKKAFPPSHYEIHRKYNVTNLKYCTWPEFKERCMQVHQFLYDQPNVKSNSIILSILRIVYA